MPVVRPVLFLVLLVVGGSLGFYLGSWYISSDPITRYIGDNPNLLLASRVGFTAIGVLLGLLAFTKVSASLDDLATNLREMPPGDKLALLAGAVFGLLLTFLLTPVFSHFQEPLRTLLVLAAALVLVFLTTQGALGMRDELRKLLPPYGAAAEEESATLKHPKILDTNIIIDGRIADICRTGFIEGTIYVPGFVLDELQCIADSADPLKRARGRRGLDILNQMQKEFPLVVRTYDHLAPAQEHEQVDHRLVRLAKALEGTIVTNDFNLNKVAGLEGIKVLNVNELANALKPVVVAGEEMRVQIIKEGKEPGQGIAYLDDGTMVVVEQARRHIGEMVDVVVSSVLQTVAGKMIFCDLKDVAEEEEATLDRNLRTYYRGGRRGRGH